MTGRTEKRPIKNGPTAGLTSGVGEARMAAETALAGIVRVLGDGVQPCLEFPRSGPKRRRRLERLYRYMLKVL